MFDQTYGNFNGFNGGMAPGYQYNGYPNNQVPKIMNVLSEEEIKELMSQRSQFSLGLTERESKQAACTHRTPDGLSDSLTYDPETGIARCTICGYEFRPLDSNTSIDSIKDAADRIVDILQTIKILYRDLPANAAREYFQIIPLVAKIPQLFEFAAKSFNAHEVNSWSYNNHNMGAMSLLQNLSNYFGANQFGGPVYQQPQMNQPFNPYQQPQQPMMNQPFNPYQQPQPMGNAFGYQGASQMPYAPQTQGFQYTPNSQPVQPVAPTAPTPGAPAPTEEATVTQNVTV